MVHILVAIKMEASSPTANYATKYAKSRNKNMNLFRGDINKLPFNKDSFDVITCIDILEHLDSPEIAIKECYDALKNDGVMLISVPNIHSIGKEWKGEDWFGLRDKTHKSLISNDKWLQLFKMTGFKVEEHFYDGLWDSPYFEKGPQSIQHLFFKIPMSIFFGFGFKFPQAFGENLYIVACKEEA